MYSFSLHAATVCDSRVDFMELCTLMFEYICEKFVSPVEDVMKWQSRIDELLGDICYLTVRLNVTKGMKDHVMEHVKVRTQSFLHFLSSVYSFSVSSNHCYLNCS